jgi:hypothetical protein
MSDLVRWFDHRGEVVAVERPPNGGRLTAYRWDDKRNHWLFGEPANYSATPFMQALTWCGRRAMEVPGRGEVDCPECVDFPLPAS